MVIISFTSLGFLSDPGPSRRSGDDDPRLVTASMVSSEEVPETSGVVSDTTVALTSDQGSY